MPLAAITLFVIGLSLPTLSTQRRSDFKRVLYHQDVRDQIQKDLQYHLAYVEKHDANIIKRYQKFIKYKEQIKLNRLQPSKKIGGTQNIPLTGKHHKKWLLLETLSKRRPLAFQIDDFLSPDECDHIKKLSVNLGLEDSKTVDSQYYNSTGSSTRYDNFGSVPFDECDTDGDLQCNVTELIVFFRRSYEIALNQLLIHDIMKYTMMDFNMDGYVEEWEWKVKNLTKLVAYLLKQEREVPHSKSRYSAQQWLGQSRSNDSVLLTIQDRLHQVTGLPRMMIQNNDELQVVKYQPGGHYDCHLDTGVSYLRDQYKPCCHLGMHQEDCNICRFMTVLYYLSDVELGGETAFPVAGQKNVTESYLDNKMFKSSCSLSMHCSKANLKVTPKKGRAIIWYNHFLDPDTGWLGATDRNSLHGGCGVHKGEKWIANNWIEASPLKEHDVLNWILTEADRKRKEK